MSVGRRNCPGSGWFRYTRQKSHQEICGARGSRGDSADHRKQDSRAIFQLEGDRSRRRARRRGAKCLTEREVDALRKAGAEAGVLRAVRRQNDIGCLSPWLARQLLDDLMRMRRAHVSRSPHFDDLRVGKGVTIDRSLLRCGFKMRKPL